MDREGDEVIEYIYSEVEQANQASHEKFLADDSECIQVAGDNWWLELGPVDLGAKLVTIQRNDKLIAAITPRDDGRLRVAVFCELDDKSKDYLKGLGQTPHPEHGVCMRENNWEYALDCSAGGGNNYAADKGEAYLSYWNRGIGVSYDDSMVIEWFIYRLFSARSSTDVALELKKIKDSSE